VYEQDSRGEIKGIFAHVGYHEHEQVPKINRVGNAEQSYHQAAIRDAAAKAEADAKAKETARNVKRRNLRPKRLPRGLNPGQMKAAKRADVEAARQAEAEAEAARQAEAEAARQAEAEAEAARQAETEAANNGSADSSPELGAFATQPLTHNKASWEEADFDALKFQADKPTQKKKVDPFADDNPFECLDPPEECVKRTCNLMPALDKAAWPDERVEAVVRLQAIIRGWQCRSKTTQRTATTKA